MDTQKIAETQRIADTQRIALDPLGKDDTQVIGLLPLPLSESSPNKVDVSKTHVSLTRANFVDPNTSTPGVNSSPSRIDIGALPTPAKASLSVLQIPNTAERTMQQPLDNGATQSLAQVRNTQEDLIDNTFHMDEIKEPKVQPVYSSSQKNVSEEICTDDEKDVNERVVDISSLPKFSQGGEKKKKKKNNMKRVGEEESDEDDNELSDVDGEEEGVLVNKKRKLTVPESQSTQTQSSSQSKSQINVLREELGYTLPPDSIIHEDSVWAEYKFKMYPGKIHEDHGEYLSIEFGDGFSNVKNQDLYMLDIRIGDKVRLKNGVVQYIVTGLERRVPLGVKGDSQIPSICCVRDYNYAYVRRISKNKIFDEKCVFLGDIYMEIEDWVEHQQRYKIGEVRVGEEKEVKVASGSTPQRRIPTRAGSNTASVNNGTNGIFEYGADKKKNILKGYYLVNRLLCI